MSQPVWQLVAQLGDMNPTEYGGYWIFEDTSGAYAPEGEILILDDEDSEESSGEVFRFIMENCTYQNGILSDNKFHPSHSVWFGDELDSLSSFYGQSSAELIEAFTSSDPIKRAFAWRAVGEYFGFYELDSYPLRLSRAEIVERYSEHPYLRSN